MRNSTSSILIFLVALFTVSSCTVENKTAVVDIQRVFDGFKYTKELQVEFKQKTQVEELILDSLYRNLTVLEREIQEGNEQLKSLYLENNQKFNIRYKRFEEYKKKMTDESDTKVLNQLYTYIDEYGLKQGYDAIISKSDEDISLVYFNKDLDVTEHLLKYVNSRYEGN